MERINSILIINLGGIGDVLLSAPALKAIRQRYPLARISLMIIPRVREAVKNEPYIDEIIIFNTHFTFAGALENLRTLMKLRGMRFDLAVNMRTLVSGFGAAKIKFLLDMIRPRLKAGRDTDKRGAFFDIRIEETTLGDKYEMDYDIDMAEALGAKVTDRSIELKVDRKSLERVKGLLRDSGASLGETLVGIHMGGKPSHRWPAGYFLEFMKMVNAKLPCRFLVTGEDAGHDLLVGMAKNAGLEIINMANRLDFKELVAMISLCRLCVYNDTGPMHIAAALGRPLVAIFGPGYLTRFDPRRISKRAAVLYNKADCAPCDKRSCISMKCLKSIQPEEALEMALALLGKREERGQP